MTRQTSTEKARTLRDKRAREGLAEVRGVWWPAHEHAQYKALEAAKRAAPVAPIFCPGCEMPQCRDAGKCAHPDALAAPAEYPECSGDENCCPENEGFGCCKSQCAPVAPAKILLPMSKSQIAEMALQEEFLLICDGLDELAEIVAAVEQFHGIK